MQNTKWNEVLRLAEPCLKLLPGKRFPRCCFNTYADSIGLYFDEGTGDNQSRGILQSHGVGDLSIETLNALIYACSIKNGSSVWVLSPSEIIRRDGGQEFPSAHFPKVAFRWKSREDESGLADLEYLRVDLAGDTAVTYTRKGMGDYNRGEFGRVNSFNALPEKLEDGKEISGHQIRPVIDFEHMATEVLEASPLRRFSQCCAQH